MGFDATFSNSFLLLYINFKRLNSLNNDNKCLLEFNDVDRLVFGLIFYFFNGGSQPLHVQNMQSLLLFLW